MRGAILAAAWLAAAALVGAGGFLGWVEWTARRTMAPPPGEVVEVEVPKGASSGQVARTLEKDGFIASALAWRIYERLHPGAGIKAGRHPISRAMSMIAIRGALAEPPLPDDVPLAMVEGWRLRDADQWLAQNGWIQQGEYLRAASDPSKFRVPFELPKGATLEGVLLPETYLVPKGTLDVDKLIQRQIDGFHERFLLANTGTISKSNRTLYDLVIMASMLEREEPNRGVRPIVAGILFKRLDKKNPLGVDATSRYTLDDWSDRQAFLQKLRDPGDPYNTRLLAGLPPSPIGAPSLASLEAALRPVASDYWYYLHDSQQNIRYGRNAEEHEANRRKYNVY